MSSERLIQDAITHPQRLERLIHELGGADEARSHLLGWKFCSEEDYVNQEYSFASEGQCGRIDVIGTFNNLTKAAIIEVKAGIVGDGAVEQVQWYISRWYELKKHSLLANLTEVVGIVLAEGFLFESKYDSVLLVEFDLRQSGFPFRTARAPLVGKPKATPPRLKNSTLVRIEDHLAILKDERLRTAMVECANLFTEPASSRGQWICINPKGEHIGVHYKGEYIAWFFVGSDSFYFGYRSPDKTIHQDDDAIIRPNNWDIRRSKIRADIQAIMDAVDKKLEKEVPVNFIWAV